MTVEVSAVLESFHTVVLPHNVPDRTEFKKEIVDKVKGLFEENTFIFVQRSDFSYEEFNGMKISKAKLVLAYKCAETTNEKQKARILVQAIGKIDKDKIGFSLTRRQLPKASRGSYYSYRPRRVSRYSCVIFVKPMSLRTRSFCARYT